MAVTVISSVTLDGVVLAPARPDEDTRDGFMKARFEEHLAGCDGCSTYLNQTQQIISELRRLSATPDSGAGVQHTAG
jgi:hypothetical protein